MKEINEMTLDELKAIEGMIKERKASLKATSKSDKTEANQAKIDAVNDMIANGELKIGMNVVVLYGSKNDEIIGKVVGVLSAERPTITVSSLDFVGKTDKNGEKRRYVEKHRIARIAD